MTKIQAKRYACWLAGRSISQFVDAGTYCHWLRGDIEPEDPDGHRVLDAFEELILELDCRGERSREVRS